MKLSHNVFRRAKQTSAKQLFIIFALFLGISLGGLTAASSMTNSSKVDAAYCGDGSGNSIMRCGAPDRATFIKKVKASKQLQAVYNQFGLSSRDYDSFIKNAKSGVAYDNNTIVVGGQVVATNVGSIGRYKSWQGSNPKTFKIAGDYYYGNSNSQAFAKNTHAIAVDVLFDSHGRVQFAVMTGNCGNPTYQTPTSPTYTCNNLIKTPVSGNTYKFSTNASAGHGATIQKVVYSFGDGSANVEQTNPSTQVTHTFTKSATVTVSVYVKLPGGAIVKLANADCMKKVTVAPPAATYACNSLTLTPGKIETNGATTYTLAAAASATNAVIKSYTFTPGDGSALKVIATDAKSASFTHTYAPGNYAARVFVRFVTNTGKNVAVGNTGTCVKPVIVKPVATKLSCDNLTFTKGAVDAATGNTAYSFTAKASTTNATINNYVFNLGDNVGTTHTATITTANTTATTSAFSYAPGTHTAKVVVNGTDVNGKTLTTAPATAYCIVNFTVPPKVTHPGVTITKYVDNVKKEEVAVNHNFTYELKVTNTGDVNLTNAVVTDTAPAGVTLVSADRGTVTSPTTWTYTIPSLAVGESTSFNLTAKVKTYVPGELVNTACVNAVEVNPTQPTKPDVCDTATVTVKPPVPGVTITKHVDNVKDEQVAVGQTFTYELVVTNTGNVDLTNAVVTDTPPTGVTLLTADKGTIANNAWTYTIPSLKVGESTSFNLTAKVPAFLDGSLVNTACVNAVEVNPGQPNKPDACDTATVHVPPVVPTNPNISITKTVDGQKSEQVAVGQTFTYQLVIKNTGEKDLVNVLVSDTAPQGVTLLTADLGDIASDTTWSYTIPSLAIGDSVTVNMTAKVDTYVAGALVNTACVNAVEVNPTQPEQNDACDTATVTVTPPVVPVTPAAPTVLPNTGAGSVISIFGAAAIVGTIGYRLFLGRRLNRQ